MMLCRAIHVAILAESPHAVLDAVVVHEMQNLLASTRGSEPARMRDTRGECEGEREHGDDRDGVGGAETHAGRG
jgi:hypothetical protein